MPVTFLHMADIHLGYHQYQSDERLKDFSRVFQAAVDDAISRQVDFVLIAGDLFHKAAVNPLTLFQAKRPLTQLRKANIPAIAISGNHDTMRYGDRFSWLDYLAADECLTVLKPDFTPDGQIDLKPVNGHKGSYVDMKGIRIVGLNYLGASTTSVLAELPVTLARLPQDVDFTVLLAHLGLEGEGVNLNGAISQNNLSPLKEQVNYLALGHIHKPIERENWVYNPGSLEACGMDERHWLGGWNYVTVENGVHRVEHIKSVRRPMHRIKIEVDSYSKPTEVYDAVRAELITRNQIVKQNPLKPIIQVWLDGVLSFDRHDLNMQFIESMIIEIIDPIKALVQNNTRATEYEIVVDDRLNRVGLEQNVFTELIIRDSRFRNHAEVWAKLMSEIKLMSLTDYEPGDIVDAISKQMTVINQLDNRMEN